MELADTAIKSTYVQAHKTAVKFIVQWMMAGGRDIQRKESVAYPEGDIINLLCLNELASYLEIDALLNRTLRSIEKVMNTQTMTSDQMARAFAVASKSSAARNILEQKLKRWIATYSDSQWKKKCQQAINKSALPVLSQLRSATKNNREYQKKLTRSQKPLQHRGIPNRQKRQATKMIKTVSAEEEKKAVITDTASSKGKEAKNSLSSKTVHPKPAQIRNGQSIIKAWRDGKLD